MGIVAWVVFGLIAGALAKFIMPGKQDGGIILTIVLGIVGAVVGGFVGTLLGFGNIAGSTCGAWRSRSEVPCSSCSSTGWSCGAAADRPRRGLGGSAPNQALQQTGGG